MTPEDFAIAIKQQVFDAAVDDVLKILSVGPPGRGPHPRADAMSTWYARLTDHDRRMVAEVTRDAAHAAIFGLLCVLDGVRVIDDPPHVELVLNAVDPTGATATLASSEVPIELHDEFNALVHPPTEPWPSTRNSG